MQVDYSSKHGVILKNKDTGLLRRMDEPYYVSELIGDGVWKIESEGCLSYLVEGEKEALVIDSGYGCGNIREFCQCLTQRPVKRIANTHDHFDHTALNGYFESAIMSEKTKDLATIPFPSFEGIEFSRDYKKEIVKEGDSIQLGGRELEVFEIPDHAAGSIALLDVKSRILFIGDEVGAHGVDICNSVEAVGKNFLKLKKRRSDFDFVCHGHMGKMNAEIIDRVVDNIEYILAGHEGVEDSRPAFHLPDPETDGEGNLILIRDMPHPGDVTPMDAEKKKYMRVSNYAGCTIKYDMRNIHDS